MVSRKQEGNPGSTRSEAIEPLDKQIAEILSESTPRKGPASILIAAPESKLREQLVELLEDVTHRCICIGRLDTALSTVSRGRFDLILLDPALPDGDGLKLLRQVRASSPATKTIIISDANSFSSAISAMRAGAVDFIIPPFEAPELLERIEAALKKSRTERQRDERVVNLKNICKELNIARHEITDQVDVLCKDLVDAYQDMAEQISEVAMTSEFKTLLKQELDVEDLLRTALQYLLTKTGPTNAAVFLPDSDQNYGLGAYVNYDCPRESISVLLDHLCYAICPQLADEKEIIAFEDTPEFADWIDADADFLSDSNVIAFSCSHEGECLAVIVLFRNKADAFDEELASTLDTIRSIFAEQLSNIIRIHHRANPRWPQDAMDDDVDFEGDDYGFGFEGGLAA